MSHERVLNSEGTRQLRNLLDNPRMTAETAAKLPEGWTDLAIPEEPGVGVYLVGIHLVARAGWDKLKYPWRYLGYMDAQALIGDLSWEQIWEHCGGANTPIRCVIGFGVETRADIISVYNTRVSVVPSATHRNAAALLKIHASHDASLDADGAIQLASVLLALAGQKQPGAR